MVLTEAAVPILEYFQIDYQAINESANSKCFIKQLSDGRYRIRMIGQRVGHRNNNKRIYQPSLLIKYVRPDSPFMAKVRGRSVVGYLEHPDDPYHFDLGLGALVVTDVSMPDSDGYIYVTFETMSTPGGLLLACYIRDRVRFCISSRGAGHLIQTSEGFDVADTYVLISFDAVMTPGTGDANILSQDYLGPIAEALSKCRDYYVTAAGGDKELASQMAHNDTMRIAESCADGSCNLPSDKLLLQVGNNYYYGTDTGSGIAPYLISEGTITKFDTAKNESAAFHKVVEHLVKSSTMPVNESMNVIDHAPTSGMLLAAQFEDEKQVKAAVEAFTKAGFACDVDIDNIVNVHTYYTDVIPACMHLLRIMNAAGMVAKNIGESSRADVTAGVNSMPTNEKSCSCGGVKEQMGDEEANKIRDNLVDVATSEARTEFITSVVAEAFKQLRLQEAKQSDDPEEENVEESSKDKEDGKDKDVKESVSVFEVEVADNDEEDVKESFSGVVEHDLDGRTHKCVFENGVVRSVEVFSNGKKLGVVKNSKKQTPLVATVSERKEFACKVAVAIGESAQKGYDPLKALISDQANIFEAVAVEKESTTTAAETVSESATKDAGAVSENNNAENQSTVEISEAEHNNLLQKVQSLELDNKRLAKHNRELVESKAREAVASAVSEAIESNPLLKPFENELLGKQTVVAVNESVKTLSDQLAMVGKISNKQAKPPFAANLNN